MEARIAIEGRDTDVESLWDWLRHKPELRGHLSTGALIRRRRPWAAAPSRSWCRLLLSVELA
jgi:hypothetical protein